MNYHLSIMDILPLHLNDEYISAEFLLEAVYIEPIVYPIHFSMNRNSIDGVCCGHIKTISLDNQQPTVVNRTDQNHIEFNNVSNRRRKRRNKCEIS